MTKIISLFISLACVMLSVCPSVGESASTHYLTKYYEKSKIHIIVAPSSKISVGATFHLYKSAKTVLKEKHAIAGVNASYYNLKTRMACGLLIVDGKLVANNVYDRPYFVITNDNYAYITDSKVVPENVRHAVGGGGYLVKDNQIFITHKHSTKEFVNTHVRRTMIGINENGEVIVVVATNCDLYKAARIMKSLHCKEAINLDGGASSQMYFKGKTLMASKRNVPVLLAMAE